ncbi:MAG TPA: hypothetical protein VF911_06670 [Thermoanaerobaculia bacterium]
MSLLVAIAAVPLFAETASGRSQTPDGELTWKIVLTPTDQENVYRCTVEVTKTATNELLFAPAITFEAGKPAVADSAGPEYTGKVTIRTTPETAAATIDLEIRKGTVDLIAARTQMRLQ